MNELSPRLKRFARRVRVVRTWRGLAIGACLGAAAAAAWAVLDWANIAFTDWARMGALVAAGAVIGAVVNALRPVPARALTVSIDRRAGLEDRLTTADERASGEDTFDEALRQDAEGRLASLQPKAVYPIRVDRWHGGTVALVAAAAAIFLLGNTPLLLNDAAKAAREEVKKEGQRVERVRKEHLESPEAREQMDDAQRKLAEEMRRLQEQLEKARMTPEEARQKANEIGKKAEELAKKSAKETIQKLSEAQTALDKMLKQELDKAGLPQADPQMAQMSDAQRQEAMERAKQKAQEAQQRIESLQSQLDALNKKLQDPKLSPEERKALKEQRKALEKEMQAAKDAKKAADQELEALKLSEEAQKVFQKMMEHPLYKKLQEMAEKMRQNAQQAAQNGQPKLTKEQREQLQKELEELAKQLADDEKMKEYLQALLDAMKETGGT